MFRVYYGDGSVFEGRPEDAPAKNVQFIVWDDPDKGVGDLGRVMLYNYDLYIYSDHVGGWHGTNKYADLINHLGYGCGPGGVRAVLQGQWIARDKFNEIRRKAENDPVFRRKSARDPDREDGAE